MSFLAEINGREYPSEESLDEDDLENIQYAKFVIREAKYNRKKEVNFDDTKSTHLYESTVRWLIREGFEVRKLDKKHWTDPAIYSVNWK